MKTARCRSWVRLFQRVVCSKPRGHARCHMSATDAQGGWTSWGKRNMYYRANPLKAVESATLEREQ